MNELFSIQYLRAVAASMVVLLHLYPQWQRMGYGGEELGWLAGGVDIFFVISGFIMWVTTARKPIGTLAFYRRRIARIVPLYWLLSAVVVAIMLVMPQAVQSTRYDLHHVLASFGFIATVNPSSGRVEPVLIPGWTLNYEMFFYLLFGLTLSLRHRWRLTVTGGMLIGLVCLNPIVLNMGMGPIPAFYTSGIMLEFLAGMILGWLWCGRRLQGGRAAGWVMIGSGFTTMALLDSWLGQPRLLVLGLPAMAIVAGALMLEQAGAVRRMVFPLQLGDASYSLYLSHPLTLSAFGQVWRKVIPDSMPGSPAFILFSVLAVVAAVAVGWVVYYVLERPLVRLFRGRKGASMPQTKAAQMCFKTEDASGR